MSRENTIRVDDLVVEYSVRGESIRALECDGFRAAAGTSVAVMGPSGCGKSTLVGVLAGLQVPTSGSVVIGQTDLLALSDVQRTMFRRVNIGVVYQADNLLPFLTVAENVVLQLALSNGGTRRDRRATARRDERSQPSVVRDLLDRLNIGDLASRLPDELSGGQRQRVAVARAVVHGPSVILADEPTGALDAANAHGVVELLVELQRDLGATLVVVTHDDGVARQLQRTIRLDGRKSLTTGVLRDAH